MAAGLEAEIDAILQSRTAQVTDHAQGHRHLADPEWASCHVASLLSRVVVTRIRAANERAAAMPVDGASAAEKRAILLELSEV